MSRIQISGFILNLRAMGFTYCNGNTYFEVIKSIKARNVENPPLRTAGPIFTRVFSTLRNTNASPPSVRS